MERLRVSRALYGLLIVAVMAGAGLVIHYQRDRVQAKSTWRSLDQPVADTSADEYAVYSTIIDKLHYEDRLWVFVVRDHTAPCVRVEEWCAPTTVGHRLHNLKPETLEDYLTQNQESVALKESFNLQRPAVLLSDEKLPELLIKTNLQVKLSPLAGRKIQWGKFYDRYPLAPGLISLSRVGFNSLINQALVYEEIQGNSDGAWGRYLKLSKAASGHWVIENKIEMYFPEDPQASVKHGEWGTLKGLILDAKAEALDEVELSSLSCGWDIRSLREALARSTVMVAEVVGKTTLADNDGLRTWYKFKIIETLSERPMPNYPTYSSLPDPPDEVQPVKGDEFVMVEVNGQMEIDGVRVIQRSNGVLYMVGGTYLIFLHVEPTKRVAFRSGTEPTGVFLVAKDGTFRAYIDRPHPLRDQLARQYGNSIEKLRKALKH